jgi:hypothetical protein
MISRVQVKSSIDHAEAIYLKCWDTLCKVKARELQPSDGEGKVDPFVKTTK